MCLGDAIHNLAYLRYNDPTGVAIMDRQQLSQPPSRTAYGSDITTYGCADWLCYCGNIGVVPECVITYWTYSEFQSRSHGPFDQCDENTLPNNYVRYVSEHFQVGKNNYPA